MYSLTYRMHCQTHLFFPSDARSSFQCKPLCHRATDPNLALHPSWVRLNGRVRFFVCEYVEEKCRTVPVVQLFL